MRYRESHSLRAGFGPNQDLGCIPVLMYFTYII